MDADKPVFVVCHSKSEPIGHVLVTKPVKLTVVSGHTFVLAVADNVGATEPEAQTQAFIDTVTESALKLKQPVFLSKYKA